MGLCNFSTIYGSAPRDCPDLQTWLDTLVSVLEPSDNMRCGSNAGPPGSDADLEALFAPCVAPPDAVAYWFDTLAGTWTTWVKCGGIWTPMSGTANYCDLMSLRVVPLGTLPANFNAFWNAEGCPNPPATGAMVIEDTTGNRWYWNGAVWTALNAGDSYFETAYVGSFTTVSAAWIDVPGAVISRVASTGGPIIVEGHAAAYTNTGDFEFQIVRLSPLPSTVFDGPVVGCGHSYGNGGATVMCQNGVPAPIIGTTYTFQVQVRMTSPSPPYEMRMRRVRLNLTELP